MALYTALQESTSLHLSSVVMMGLRLYCHVYVCVRVCVRERVCVLCGCCLCVWFCLNLCVSAHVSLVVRMGWPRLVGSIKLQVSFAEYSRFYRALLQRWPIIWSILLTEATSHVNLSVAHMYVNLRVAHMYANLSVAHMYVNLSVAVHIYVYVYKNTFCACVSRQWSWCACV